MALTNIASETARAGSSEQIWSSKVLFWAYKNMWMRKLLGTVVREEKGLEKSAGDVATYQIVAPLVSAGKTDTAQRGDGGESLTVFTDKVELHANKHECGFDSEISQQRTSLNLRNLAKEGLGQWAAQTLDTKFLYVASGIVTPDALIAANAPSTARKWYGGQTAAGAVESVVNDAAIDSTTDNLMGPEVLSVIRRKAEISDGATYPKLQPIIWEGKELYICIMHPYQLRDFRNSTSFKNKAYYVDAKDWRNPLTNGAEFIWDKVIVYSWDKILTRVGGGNVLGTNGFEADYVVSGDHTIGRALFFGKDAVTLAWGKKKMRWSEYEYPHGDGWSAGVEMIQGFKKTEFNGYDFGVITIDTMCVADA